MDRLLSRKGLHLSLLLRKKLIGSDLRRKPLLYQRPRKKADEYLCVQTPAQIITYVGDSSDNEEEETAPKTGLSLKELMKGRNKVPSP